MMHFQIRKKERYLLIGMIWYLVIVSCALFLIFSPVNAYTLEHTTTIIGTGTGYGSQGNSAIYVKNLTQFLALQPTRLVYTASSIQRFEDGPPFVPAGSMNCQLKYASGYCNCTASWEQTYSGNSADYLSTTEFTLDLLPEDYCDYTKTGGESQLQLYHRDGVNSFQNDDMGWNSSAIIRTLYNATKPASSSLDIWRQYGSGKYYGGVWEVYSGSETPDIPEITDFTVERNCYYPNESVILHANVTGTVDTWNWKVYDLNGTVISETTDPVDTVTDPLQVVGLLAAKVTVTNAGGSDDDYRTQFINVSQPGTCNFTPYDPFPTVTVSPTIQVYPILTLPAITDTNMTGINTEIDELWIIGNMSEGYREMVDYYGEGVNTTFTGLVGIIVSPFTFIANAVSTGSTLFSSSISSLMSYTTVPLAIVGITLGFYPWQIITLITAGIAVDAIFVLIFGVR